MAGEQMPRVRELSGLTANIVMLRSVVALLRAEYRDVLDQPLPKQLSKLVQQLPENE